MKVSKLFSLLFILIILVGCQQSTTEQSNELLPMEEPAPTIEGTWELVSITGDDETDSPYKSLIIFTDKYYSIEIAMKERPSWSDLAEGEERSCDDISSAYNDFISNSGAYTIQGDSLIREAIVAKSPNYMNDGPRTASAFTLNGDQLTTSGRQMSVWTYKRLK